MCMLLLVLPNALDGFSVNSANSGGDWDNGPAAPHGRSVVGNESWHNNGFDNFGIDNGLTPTSDGVIPGDTGNGLYWFWDPIWSETLVSLFPWYCSWYKLKL
jgi:hypothetical protein